ncbi:hypothetical protein [Serratia ureilytica]|uniref:hypothetical protein n=1 Tax=Serratia ureilytica TaxID=300181 RepID=UPI001D17F123|nr:hypothetical protein [Serratia ureilytica]MCC4104947.1 hypothetical protein [Serratia ureilytica]
MAKKWRLFFLMCVVMSLAACDRVPACDSQKARDLMEETVYSMVARSLSYPFHDAAVVPDAMLDLPERAKAVIGLYNPDYVIWLDSEWLRRYFEAQNVGRYQHSDVTVYLMLRNFDNFRKAVQIHLVDYEPLSDRTIAGRRYTKVCRAKLLIGAAAAPSGTITPITVTYSLNPEPQSSRLQKASPFYIAVNFFDVEVPQLALSDIEKVQLMAMGITTGRQEKPVSLKPEVQVLRLALNAVRHSLENETK